MYVPKSDLKQTRFFKRVYQGIGKSQTAKYSKHLCMLLFKQKFNITSRSAENPSLQLVRHIPQSVYHTECPRETISVKKCFHLFIVATLIGLKTGTYYQRCNLDVSLFTLYFSLTLFEETYHIMAFLSFSKKSDGLSNDLSQLFLITLAKYQSKLNTFTAAYLLAVSLYKASHIPTTYQRNVQTYLNN